MDNSYRQFRADALIQTAEGVAGRVRKAFPDRHLSAVAAAVVEVTREATARAETIRQPNWWLRLGLMALALLTAAGLIAALVNTAEPLHRLVNILPAFAGASVALVSGVVFLWNLENLIKRRRAVRAIHELRAMAHIIDLHQLRKAPEHVVAGDLAAPAVGGAMTVDTMTRYLTHCTELLALLSKIGQLYVQDFPDGVTLAAVDQFENLATGLSQKIWQKLMILERFRTLATPASA
jgi:hypothetical protein